MSRSLVIVESPAKARTLKKFLGSHYAVRASIGHVRDLPKSRLGVDVERGFAPTYVTIKGKGEVIKELRAAVKEAARVYLATDPDREGEAIAWHLAEVLKLKHPRRIELHEITRRAAQDALKHPSDINTDRVNAQQARRVLDRLVGYKISPLLWRKVRGGLSAGRVQSVAVKFIVDREREIAAFVAREFWSIKARLWPHGYHDRLHTFEADLLTVDGEKIDLPNEAAANAIKERLYKASFAVQSVKTADVQRNPAKPFKTSTLQQEASRRLKMRVRRTMQIAQGLYEGIDVGDEGTVGLITYMRTDSERLSGGAIAMARDYVAGRFGADYSNVRQFKADDAAQDAHEAIRPTEVNRTPDSIAKFLDPAQRKIYRLIWERFVASQMAAAIYDQTTVDVEADGCGLRATGTELKFPGYTAIYEESREEDAPEEEHRKRLPPLADGQALDLRHLDADQHFTQPPPRYTEATLVKALEDKDIGRPSTYAAIVDTIQQRGYAHLEQRRFVPEEIGCVVTDLLAEHFPTILDVNFTADMERKLDRVEDAHDDWLSLLREFYGPFSADLKHAEEVIEKVELAEDATDEICPTCGRPMRIKWSRHGKFLGCTGYPECTTTKPIVKDSGVLCPCEGQVGCEHPVPCGGRILERLSKKGRAFWGCERWPACRYVAFDPPIPGSACAICGAFLVRKRSRTGGRIACSMDRTHRHGYAEPQAA